MENFRSVYVDSYEYWRSCGYSERDSADLAAMSAERWEDMLEPEPSWYDTPVVIESDEWLAWELCPGDEDNPE